MKLIKLTSLQTGKPIWVNAERIEIVEPNENGSTLWLVNQTDMFEVREQHFTIAELVNNKD